MDLLQKLRARRLFTLCFQLIDSLIMIAVIVAYWSEPWYYIVALYVITIPIRLAAMILALHLFRVIARAWLRRYEQTT